MKNILVNKIKFKGIHARMVAAIATVAVASTFLCGCEYIDGVLEKFDLIDNDYDDSPFLDTDETASEGKEATDEAAKEGNESLNSGASGNVKGPESFDFSAFYRKFFDTDSDGEVKKVRDEAGLTEENIEKVKKNQEGYYAFDKLTDAGKTLYAELLLILKQELEDVYVSTTSEQAIDIVFNYLMIDHPEIFWVEGYSFKNGFFGSVHL